MRPLTRAVAQFVVIAAVLTGCGSSGSDGGAGTNGSDDNGAATPSATAADGDTITTDKFTYTVPQGWKESDQLSSGAMTLAINLEDKDGFSDNFNVVRDDTVVGIEGQELEDALENVLKGAKATDVTVRDRIQVDGEEAVHVGAIFEQNGTKYRTEQYAVDHDKAGYVLTVSFSESVPDAQRDEVSESILATWKWVG